MRAGKRYRGERRRGGMPGEGFESFEGRPAFGPFGGPGGPGMPGMPPRPMGPFGHGFGPGHGHGGRGGGRGWGGPRRGGRARRGDVRASLLALLKERPMHGYEMITEIGERTGGAWRPSPGSVYPTLQLLEEEGLIAAQETGGRSCSTSPRPGVPRPRPARTRPGRRRAGESTGRPSRRSARRWAPSTTPSAR
ncbi:hypothetical protein GCM10025734_29100 [Kitasatospora paranensis]